MDHLQLKAALAGICFGIYPILLNRSGLSGYASATAFTFIVFLTVAPFSLFGRSEYTGAHWLMMAGSGVVSGIGMIFLTKILSGTTPQQVPALVVMMTIVQIVVTALYQVLASKTLSPSKGIGFALAVGAVIFLSKK
jgi:drug/metabolite transporter (DMT)-like permease